MHKPGTFTLRGRLVRYRQTDRGLGLLEVMIALLVLSIGLLGLLALQTRALRVGELADMQQRAMALALEIGERMRANPAGVRHGPSLLPGDRQQTPVFVADRPDSRAWLAQLARLPDGAGEIVPCNRSSHPPCPAAGGHVVTVFWNARRDPSVIHRRCPPRTEADMQCYRHLVSASRAFTTRHEH